MEWQSSIEMPDEAPLSLPELIASQIRDRIADGTFSFGAPISDKELATQLGVSRTPVREALLQLKQEGLVEVRPSRGSYIFEPTLEDLEEICEARGQYEASAARLLTGSKLSLAPTVLTPLLEETEAALKRGDLRSCEQLDTQFHESLIALAGNRYLEDSYSRITTKIRALRHRLPQSPERVRNALSQHRMILALLLEGDREAAAAILTSHVRIVERLLSDQIVDLR